MIVKVDSIKTECDRLNSLIEDYNMTILNMYNELSFSENYWRDRHSMLFFDNIKTEKRKNLNFVTELRNYKDTLNYLVKSYQAIGNKIDCTLKNKDSVIGKFDQYLNKLDSIISTYNRLNLYFCPREASYLNYERSLLEADYNRMNAIRSNVKKTFEKIQSIENEVKLRLSRINIEYIKETDISGVL